MFRVLTIHFQYIIKNKNIGCFRNYPFSKATPNDSFWLFFFLCEIQNFGFRISISDRNFRFKNCFSIFVLGRSFLYRFIFSCKSHFHNSKPENIKYQMNHYRKRRYFWVLWQRIENTLLYMYLVFLSEQSSHNLWLITS